MLLEPTRAFWRLERIVSMLDNRRTVSCKIIDVLSSSQELCTWLIPLILVTITIKHSSRLTSNTQQPNNAPQTWAFPLSLQAWPIASRHTCQAENWSPVPLSSIHPEGWPETPSLDMRLSVWLRERNGESLARRTRTSTLSSTPVCSFLHPARG